MANALVVITVAVLQNLSDKLFEKRKNAALEIEGIVKQLRTVGDHDKIMTVINLLMTKFTYSLQANHRKAMVAHGDLGAELPIEDVPLLQEEIISTCHRMGKLVIVATNMLESMINHPTPTRVEVSDIAIAVREGADVIMLSIGEAAHGKYPIKAVKVMHTVALRNESTLLDGTISTNPGHAFQFYKSHMGVMFAYHATTMANTLKTPIIVFTC